MKFACVQRRNGGWRGLPAGFFWAWLGLFLAIGAARASQHQFGNPDFLIENWLEDDGLPESSAYCLAQSKNGYLWVGTAYGVMRYNGIEFTPTGRASGSPVLAGVIQCLYADPEGQVWASGDLGVAVVKDGVWRTIRSTNTVARTMAEDAGGTLWLGTYDGRLFTVQSNSVQPAAAPPGLAASGVFCLRDARDGGLWLANKGFIGRLTPKGWLRLGPTNALRNALLATTAKNGGVWTYTPGSLTKYETDGTHRDYRAPDLEMPRALLEDQEGTIWLASLSRGYVRMQPGGPILATVNATNGLVHNSAWCMLQDTEGNMWLGSSCGGLSRLNPKVFHVISVPEGLPNQIVRSVAEVAPGQMIVGTHGQGTAIIENGKVTGHQSNTNRAEDYAWSVLRDDQGRTWTGTYGGGLWRRENGSNRNVPLPPALGMSVPCLMQDTRHRIWVGTGTGLGVVENGTVRDVSSKTPLAGSSVWAMAEDPRTGVLWVGTFASGLFRIEDRKVLQFGLNSGLPTDRISAAMVDQAGNAWFGLYDKGLACMRDGGRFSFIGLKQGYPGFTAGFIIEDRLGWIWFGTDHGILRASEKDLDEVASGQRTAADFVRFDASDGLYSADCVAGFQPAATRDQAGHLWFATMNGVVTVDPAQIRLNTTVPPVILEHFTYKDAKAEHHVVYTPMDRTLDLPPGCNDFAFGFAALSYSAPGKNRYAYWLENFDDGWVSLGNRHLLSFHVLPPGTYRLHYRASNNFEAWNDNAPVLTLLIEPYYWQTWWFPLVILLAVALAGGLAAWRLTLARMKQRIAKLEQQRALEQERARLATVMEATTDLVAFADNGGRLLHLNPAGRRLLGLAPREEVSNLTLADLNPPQIAEVVSREGIPAAREAGIWQAETHIIHRNGSAIPVHQTILAHLGEKEGDSFLSTIARDLRPEKQAEQESERLQVQLLQAQKMESVGRLAGGIAHDFNNMLQIIIGNADLALQQMPAGTEVHGELMEIQKSASRSAELTRQLLTFARKQIFRAQELNLDETVSGTSKMLERLIGENIQLIVRAEDDLWPVRMDPSQVTQILTNLAINARDAIQGQGTLAIDLCNVTIAADSPLITAEVKPGDFVQLMVTDSGQGMPQEVMDHLYEPFFTTKPVGKGTGLGLATVFGIVKQHHGIIQAESVVDQGTTFRIYFPRSATMNINTTQPARPAAPIHGTETILIVEDEENILQLIVLTLRKHGYKIIAAKAPELALTVAASHPGKIDLLITDVVMPGMNGKQLQEKLQAAQPSMKSLFMSGYTAEIIAQHGDLDPGLNFVQKPFAIQNFLEKVRKILGVAPSPKGAVDAPPGI